jgi:hypothetical protein
MILIYLIVVVIVFVVIVIVFALQSLCVVCPLLFVQFCVLCSFECGVLFELCLIVVHCHRVKTHLQFK